MDNLVTSFPKNAPFRAAIEESGQGTFRAPVANPAANWNALAAAVGCNGSASLLKCMRTIPAATLKNSSEHLGLAFSPMVDNFTYVANRTEARMTGNIAKVPVLAGTNANEGSLFTYGDMNTTAYLATALPTAPQIYLTEIMSAYPIGSPGIANVSQQIAAIYTELNFQCTAARQLRDNKAAGIPTWRFVHPEDPCRSSTDQRVNLDTSTTPPSHSCLSSPAPARIIPLRFHSSGAHTDPTHQPRPSSRNSANT